MRSDPLRAIADGDATSQQAGHSFLFRGDRKNTTTELLMIQKLSLLGAVLVLGVAVVGATAMIVQLRAGFLLGGDRGLAVVVVCGLLLGSAAMFGMSKLARRMRLDRSRLPES
jgi:uncharacterized membrane protein YbhN (UPF0104 family)